MGELDLGVCMCVCVCVSKCDGQAIIKEHAKRHLETATLGLRALKCN